MNDVLQSIEDISIENLEDLKLSKKLRNIKAVKIYFCFYGHNAWNSTWAQTYTRNCMHVSLESAKEFAEKYRSQGSVFYIKELPALCIESAGKSLIITEINKDCPLSNYSINAVRSGILFGKKEITYCNKNNFLTLGAPLIGIILSFKHNSRFWRVPQSKDNSVTFLYSKAKQKYEVLKTTKLKTWKSTSIGKDYYLTWKEINRKVSQSAVFRLYNQSGFNEKNI